MTCDWTLDLQGSEVQWTQMQGGQMLVRFSAASVRQGLGKAAEEGHVKGLTLLFDQATVHSGDLALCMGALSDCSLLIDGVPQRRMPLPFTASGDVRVELQFRSGSTLTLSARAVHCLPPPDAHFQTAYAC